MLWRGLSVFVDTESPVVVVLSESMEPEFKRGDLLFLSMASDRVSVLDIPVFRLDGREVPIVHRALRAHDSAVQKTASGREKQFILTKGDNNQIDDRGLYERGRDWIHREHILGRVTGHIPYVGMVTIIMNDYPIVKKIVVALLGIFILFTREQ